MNASSSWRLSSEPVKVYVPPSQCHTCGDPIIGGLIGLIGHVEREHPVSLDSVSGRRDRYRHGEHAV